MSMDTRNVNEDLAGCFDWSKAARAMTRCN